MQATLLLTPTPGATNTTVFKSLFPPSNGPSPPQTPILHQSLHFRDCPICTDHHRGLTTADPEAQQVQLPHHGAQVPRWVPGHSPRSGALRGRLEQAPDRYFLCVV
ncbi:hypothetical protein GBA52_005709 [Prunus armeniaca]|nr:hypothetical protein GBA52_005709 [Prunus armeniaca]